MKTNYTKKIVLATLVTFGLFTAAKAQNDDQSAYDDQYAQPQQQYAQPQQQYTQPVDPQYTEPQQQYTQPVDPQYDQSFDYYPDANVYYDNSCGRYIYNDGGVWVTVNTLPVGISLYGAPCYRVYHRGPQVWLDNAFHIRNFRGGYRGGYRPAVAYGGYRGGYGGYRGGFQRQGFNGGGRGFDNRGGGGRGFENHSGGGGRQAHYRR
jgi:hypothetical protein